ncbi:hypothetical protein [Bacteroides thetaiotaomicron]|uniref:hypothetical protein n=1 Tax=Bacteroides thetaiotaomicron TaxID=818 RepID=UPI001F32841A|nr:hypothetical protein [Bacteroides thetaiotaomicron]MCE9245661.1 hypothetical protein [Bacteroides thetaiotaomicron]
MDAIGLNPIKLDAIGLDPIRMNAIRLGVPGASSGSGRPYIDPELLSHVKMAISTWGKSNDDPDRTVLKDLSGNGNDMRLLNFGFAENSGYGLYSTDFTTWTKSSKVTSVDYKSFNFDTSANWVLLYHKSNLGKDTPSFKVYINADGALYYNYINQEGILKSIAIKSEDFETPVSYNTLYMGETPVIIGFTTSGACKGSITQLPDFEGWLYTDGVDDIIESVKPISEMLEGSNEITVVSIIHQISLRGISDIPLTNYIRESNIGYVRNELRVSLNKTGIYGYTCFNIQSPISSNSSVINNILGDKEDYRLGTYGKISNAKLSVQGFIDSSGAIIDTSQVAYAGGFIANKVLTTDEINQIIAYFNLDRPGQIIKPQLYCNIKKQGITNDNHAEFNDQLIDFVGGRNIQFYNVAWEGESGINSYPVVFGDKKTWDVIRANDGVKWNYKSTPNSITIYKVEHPTFFIMYSYARNSTIINEITISEFRAKISGLKEGEKIQYYYISSKNTSDNTILNITTNGTYTFPTSVPIQVTDGTPQVVRLGFLVNLNDNISTEGVKIEILPTIENALCLDGINDFGKATGLPILKDYTVVADRKILGNNEGGTLSKSYSAGNGAFIFESGSVNYSFGTGASGSGIQSKRMLSYLSKYIYNGNPIQAGTGVDSDSMWLGTLRDGDSRFSKFALWSLMLFPYSLSEFLLERQLRKYKAGTLYPDMIEFRPIVKSNIPYSSISYSVNPGEYVTEGSTVTITVTLSNASDKLVGVSSNAISDISISGDNGTYEITGKVTKSPQKISIVISSYLTMLNNDTLISNETLIKNE